MTSEDRRLEAAVERGIISVAQAAAIRALDVGVGDDAREHARRRAPDGPDATMDGGFVTALLGDQRSLSAATIAYSLGALTVVGAMGWFLADRWDSLGPWGVLAIVAIYATLFLVAAHVMRREGFATAAGLAVLLAVLLTPLAVVAVNDLTGWFGDRLSRGRSCLYPDFLFWSCRGLEVVAELATAAVALFALRRVRFGLLVAPLVAIALRMLFHLSDGFFRDGFGGATSGWTWMIGGSVLAATAYATDRGQRGDEDFAFWIHCGAAIAAFGATITLVDAYPVYRHLLVPAAFVAFAAALLLRRRPWALLGTVWFGWYVGWLAADYFRHSPAFPILLAALGLALIIATVWVQRNAARLVVRFGTVTADGRPRFPGGVPLLLAPALVALLMMGDGMERDRQRERERRWQEAQWRRRMVREAAQRDGARAATPGAALRELKETERRETPPP